MLDLTILAATGTTLPEASFYQVRGALGDDPTEPPHSAAYPFPPVPDEPFIADLRRRLAAQGLHPAPLPLGVDLERWLAHGATTWDAFPNTCGGKMDAETVALAAALQHPNLTLLTGARVTRLRAEGRRVTGVEFIRAGRDETLSAPVVCLCTGAVVTAALLLASADADHPTGLANGSDQVGRNFMNHNLSAVLGLHPLRRNTCVYEKTIQLNDWYLTGGPGGRTLGQYPDAGPHHRANPCRRKRAAAPLGAPDRRPLGASSGDVGRPAQPGKPRHAARWSDRAEMGAQQLGGPSRPDRPAESGAEGGGLAGRAVARL